MPIYNDELSQYIGERFAGEDVHAHRARVDSQARGLPAISVRPEEGRFLQLLAAASGGHKAVEIGTLGGYSAIWLARALPAGGRLITLEVDPKHADVARANLARAGLAGVAEVRLGRAVDTLPVIAAEGRGPFDLIFIDADKQSNPEYFTWALELSRIGSLIVVDNVVRDGAVADASSDDPIVQGVRRLNELIAAEPRVSAIAMQTVGSKGYDGMAFALVVGT
jgi:predicted O-methyltransferase YrrM